MSSASHAAAPAGGVGLDGWTQKARQVLKLAGPFGEENRSADEAMSLTYYPTNGCLGTAGR